MLPYALEEINMRMNEMYESFGDSGENMRTECRLQARKYRHRSR